MNPQPNNQELAINQKATTLRTLMEKNKDQFAVALPKHLSADRLLRIAMTEARKNPALLDCTQASFLGSIIQTAQLGLEPGNQTGHAYLVPFKNKDKGVTEVQLIIGYRGLIDLMYRSSLVSHVVVRAVYDTDKFSYQYGIEEKLEHTPDPLAAGDKLTHVYIVVFLKSGGRLFDVMTSREVEAARKRSKSPNKGPWVDDYEAMAMKSVVRKFAKYAPFSIELQQAAALDEAGDRGDQDNAAVLDLSGAEIPGTRHTQPKSKAEQLKDDLSGGDDLEFNHEEQGDFAKFTGQPPGKGAFSAPEDESAEQEPAQDEPEKSHEELVLEVLEVAEKAGLTLATLTTRCKKNFQLTPRELTVPQLKILIADLRKEADKKGKK